MKVFVLLLGCFLFSNLAWAGQQILTPIESANYFVVQKNVTVILRLNGVLAESLKPQTCSLQGAIYFAGQMEDVDCRKTELGQCVIAGLDLVALDSHSHQLVGTLSVAREVTAKDSAELESMPFASARDMILGTVDVQSKQVTWDSAVVGLQPILVEDKYSFLEHLLGYDDRTYCALTIH